MHDATTWRPLTEPYDQNDNGKLDRRERRALPDSAFAFPVARELPLVDAEDVRAAIAALGQVVGVTESDREVALSNIREAAAYYGVSVDRSQGRDD